MKNLIKTIAALLLIIPITVTAFPFVTEISAATLVYSKESNSGTRHVVCTTLEGTGADKYYIGSYTYDNLKTLSATELFDELRELMTVTHTKTSSYDDCRNMAPKTDCENNDGRINLIYSSKSIIYDANQSGKGWNREYVWPKSLGADTTSGGGADLHHIRISDNGINNKRNSLKYGNVDGGTAATGGSLVGNTFIGGYYGDGFFEPHDNVKGDVARICLYMYVRWNTAWKCTNIEKVFESVDVLLEWCALDPVDTWEMGRNEVVSAYQGNRNVFIDYPELAWLMFNRDIPDEMVTPSGGAVSGDPSCPHTDTELRNASPANCGYDGYTGDTHCVSCGKKISSGTLISASGDHEYGTWETSETHHARECTVCKKQSEKESHIYDNSCDAECNICEYTRPITHSYGPDPSHDDKYHWYVCSVCNVLGTKSDHVYYNACDETCNHCSYVRTITHSFRSEWSGDESGHWHACSVCGIYDKKLSHQFANDADTKCDMCGYKRSPITVPSTTKPSQTRPSTTAQSTVPDITTQIPSTGDAEPKYVGQKDSDMKLMIIYMLSALCISLILGIAAVTVFKKRSH